MAYCSWQGLFISLIGEDHFEAAARMDQMVEVAERSDSFFLILVFSVAKANVLLGMEDFGAALSSSQKALKAIEGKTIRTGHVVNLYYDLVLAELESGDQESAKRHYEDYTRAEECFQKSIQGDEEVGAVVPPAQTRFYLARMLALRGEAGRAREMLTEIRSQFQSWGIPAWQQKCEQELEALDSQK
jgi:tetratricopeptide (TPR) repeat protein